MRGKGFIDPAFIDTLRITPAHAGKSELYERAESFALDHPRPCGEKIPPEWHGMVRLGSPPPMRGKVVPPYALTYVPRITPAHAGKRGE